MSIQLGPITKCYVCGEEPNTMEHVCKWEKSLAENYDFLPIEKYADIKNSTRQLILDAYHRGHKDGNKGLTHTQTLLLENLRGQLEHSAGKINDILNP